MIIFFALSHFYFSDLLATEFLPPNFDENKKYAVHFEV